MCGRKMIRGKLAVVVAALFVVVALPVLAETVYADDHIERLPTESSGRGRIRSGYPIAEEGPTVP
jgi:hypothetical protein